jgi:REP element-mobilizing transposase RayT
MHSNDKYRGKYRIDSSRLKKYDYSLMGVYYFTIVTKGREHFFGEIIDRKMVLNEIGKIAWEQWLFTPKIRPDMNLDLIEFIVMPNHVHGLIYIGRNIYNTPANDVNTCQGGDAKHGVSTLDLTNMANLQYENTFGPQRKNLASIMRGLKSAITVNARKINYNFGWQERFNDRIVRNQNELNRINDYIRENPEKWDKNKNQDQSDLWL